MPLGRLVMDTCQGCQLSLSMDNLYVCDCICQKTMCLGCLKKHVKEIHAHHYHVPNMLRGNKI